METIQFELTQEQAEVLANNIVHPTKSGAFLVLAEIRPRTDGTYYVRARQYTNDDAYAIQAAVRAAATS